MKPTPAWTPFLPLLLAPVLALALMSTWAGATEGEDARIFQEQVETIAGGSRIPGLVIALREADGSVLLGVVGTADVAEHKPMRADTSFHIGSISQSMMAAMVLMLKEEGKLELGDSISSYLEFPGGESVTVEMLLDHSSGFADWTGRDITSTNNPQLPELLRSPQSAGSLLKIAAAAEPAFEPGTMQAASYTNLLLLSRLVGKVESKPASEVFRERIFEPLGMQDTRYLGPEDALESLASGYRAEEGWGERLGAGLTDVSWADRSLRGLADMGIVSTAEDLLKYHAGLRDGALISGRSFERMRRVRPGKVNGLGYQIARGARGTWEGNNGHAVGHLSASYYHVEERVYVVVMGNLGDAALPLARLWDLRYGNPDSESGDNGRD